MRALTGDEKNRTALQKRLRALGASTITARLPISRIPKPPAPRTRGCITRSRSRRSCLSCWGCLTRTCFWGFWCRLCVNALVYYGTKRVWMRELGAIRRLASMLHCARKMRRFPVAGMEDAFSELDTLCAALRPMVLWNSLHEMERAHEFDFITDYLRIAFQLDVVSLIRLSGFIKKHGAEITKLYLLVGEIDACIAVASVRKSLKQYAVPEFWDREKRVTGQGDVAHPSDHRSP